MPLHVFILVPETDAEDLFDLPEVQLNQSSPIATPLPLTSKRNVSIPR